MTVAIESWLERFIEESGAVAGTVHVRDGQDLVLCASVNIPPPVIAATRIIPKGKGMAGLAWERNRPVATCNLRKDETGDVRPGAKAVNAQAALAIPVRDSAGGVRAVVGVAFLSERDFSADDLTAFEGCAAGLELD
jgi:hypothetical protein